MMGVEPDYFFLLPVLSSPFSLLWSLTYMLNLAIFFLVSRIAFSWLSALDFLRGCLLAFFTSY